MQDAGQFDVCASMLIGYRGTIFLIPTVTLAFEYRISRVSTRVGNSGVGFVAAARFLGGRFSSLPMQFNSLND
jgi:hypothetical protein